MGRMLQELGVEEEKLILEKEAVDTITNAHNVLKLVQDEVLVHQVKSFRSNIEGLGWESKGMWQRGWDDVRLKVILMLAASHLLNSKLLQEKVQLIIVTSAYHMPRSVWLFRSYKVLYLNSILLNHLSFFLFLVNAF